MSKIGRAIHNYLLRQQLLPQELRALQMELQQVYEINKTESGVIDRGYYTAFSGVLERYRMGGLFERWAISEEQHEEGGFLAKIPVIDVIKSNENKRLFVIPQDVKNHLNI